MGRKIGILVLVTACFTGLFSGCASSVETASGNTQGTVAEEGRGKFSVVCTSFPQYDWLRELIRGREEAYELTLLTDNGTDLHNYQPTVEDMVAIASCDLFVYGGGSSDAWAEDALREGGSGSVVELMERLGAQVKTEEIIEGMEGYGHQGEEGHTHGEEDEHIWLSLRHAMSLTEALAHELEALDTAYAELYRENKDSYLEKLAGLDRAYEEAAAAGTRDTLVFGDRFPFRYLTDDYGLGYYAAFTGCSTETEASFATVAFLAGKVEELELTVLLVLENSDQKIAASILGNTAREGVEILSMNSLQSVTAKEMEEGISYLSVMEENLATLKRALE